MHRERRQFRTLLRIFFARSLDLELLAPGGDMQKLMIQFAALLAAVNLVTAFMMVPRYATSRLPHATLLIRAWQDEEFLIATTIAVVGVFLVIAWDTLIPDYRDTHVLGPLPIRTRTVLLVRAVSLAAAVVGVVLLVNVFTGVAFALIAAPEGSGAFGIAKTFLSYWTTVAAAAMFTSCLIVSVQGVAAQLLSYRLFLRASSLIQLVAFVLILTTYFLKPQIATPYLLSADQNQFWLRWIPSFWFLGLFQELNGSMNSVFRSLAMRAIAALSVVAPLAAIAYSLAYWRTAKRILEEAEISTVSRDRRRSAPGRLVIERLFPIGASRAITFFLARTLFRSRQHRLLLSLYWGIGAAFAFGYASGLLSDFRQQWNALNFYMLAATFNILLFAVLGVRLTFAFPVNLPANWIFRVTADQQPALYLRAIRSSLYLFGAFPAWVISAAVLFTLWPARLAFQHMLILLLTGVILVDRSLQGFGKIPFTCSYMPGETNLNVTLGMYAFIILVATQIIANMERWAIGRSVRYAFFISVFAAVALWNWHQFNAFAARHSSIQFQEVALAELLRLDMRPDGELIGRA